MSIECADQDTHYCSPLSEYCSATYLNAHAYKVYTIPTLSSGFYFFGLYFIFNTVNSFEIYEFQECLNNSPQCFSVDLTFHNLCRHVYHKAEKGQSAICP